MQTRKLILPIAFCAALVAAQQVAPSNKDKLDQTTLGSLTVGPGKPPLHPKTCKGSSFGYVNVRGRFKLTPQELGEYIAAKTSDGEIVTAYPETADGFFVTEKCPEN